MLWNSGRNRLFNPTRFQQISGVVHSVLESDTLLSWHVRATFEHQTIRIEIPDRQHHGVVVDRLLTMMKGVVGACVAAAANPTLPSTMSAVVWGPILSSAMSLPSAASIGNAGAKIPAAAPVQAACAGGNGFDEHEYRGVSRKFCEQIEGVGIAATKRSFRAPLFR
jgi:hypothetical protein